MKINSNISCLILFLLAVQINLYADRIIVEKKTSVSSISQAIKIAKPYDEIIIRSGEYTEGNIIIDKPLKITGDNFPVLYGEE